MSVKIERLEHKFISYISSILRDKVDDERISFVTVTDVSITNDLSYAKVYVTVFDDKKKDETLKLLNKASKFIERELCEMVEIRKMPELKFIYDESIDYSNNIESIIENINKHE